MQSLRRILGLRSAEETTTPSVATAPAGAVASGSPAAPPKPKTATVDGATRPLSMEGRTRQLEPLEPDLPSNSAGARLIVGHRSDVGQVRDNNQDALSAFTSVISSAEDKPDFGLFIVADGMGGHEDGEKASGMAARIIAKNILSDVFMPLLTEGSTFGSAEQTPLADTLKSAVQRANDYISTHVPDGGTTATAVTIVGHLAVIAHVGDSRAYLISKDGIEQLTRDHSLVQRLIELGQLTPAEAAEHPQRNVLYRAIGQNESLDVDAVTRHLNAGSYVLICSDGLWNLVSAEEILTIVLNHGSNTQLACQTLIDLANERGGNDNISVIIVRVPE